MNKKKIAIIIIVAVVVAVGGYFGLMQFRDTTPVLAEGFGILEPEVEIRNIYPGYVASAPLTILCGQDQDRVFVVTLEQPNLSKLPDGYEAFPEDYYYWFYVNPQSYQGGSWTWDRIDFLGDTEFGDLIIVEAGHYRKLAINVTMPAFVDDYWDKKTELRVRVAEVSTTGLVQLAIESKWYIITASKEDMESL